MGFVQGSNTFAVGKIKLGSTDIDKIYFGSTEAWPAVPTPPAVDDIVFTIDTRNLNSGSTAANQFRLPTYLTGGYNFIVDWGDGTSNPVNGCCNTQSLHTYATGGIYTIICSAYQYSTPIYRGFTFDSISSSDDKAKMLSFTQWGALDLAGAQDSGIGDYFRNCTNLDLSTVTDILNLSNVDNFELAFSNTTNITSINRINEWNVSTIVNFSNCFSGSGFNGDLNLWDVSNATNFGAMFANNTAFDGDISSWNTSSVTDMGFMFFNATAFNQNIGSWVTLNVVYMNGTFDGASAFNQNIGSWDTSSVPGVLYMGSMFNNATAFNQDLSGWCVTNITTAPANFDTGATAWTLPKPVWGTCP